MESACEARGISVPSLKSVFEPEEDPAFCTDSDVEVAAATLHHLNAIVKSSYITLNIVSRGVNTF